MLVVNWAKVIIKLEKDQLRLINLEKRRLKMFHVEVNLLLL